MSLLDEIYKQSPEAAASSLGDYLSTIVREFGDNPLGPIITVTIPLTAAMMSATITDPDGRVTAMRRLRDTLDIALSTYTQLFPLQTPLDVVERDIQLAFARVRRENPGVSKMT